MSSYVLLPLPLPHSGLELKANPDGSEDGDGEGK